MDLYLTPLDWVVTVVSMVGSIALGTYLALRMRSGENSENFFLAGPPRLLSLLRRHFAPMQ